jgi:3'-phosphoadenosine 5'-phosphosulfate sulfotransferase (PAPS reductase)/FAD synthetase
MHNDAGPSCSSPPRSTTSVGARFGKQERLEIRANFTQAILSEMKEAYLADDRPWVVGFSGGKDSTALGQFVYYMLARLSPELRRKPVCWLASDTHGS